MGLMFSVYLCCTTARQQVTICVRFVVLLTGKARTLVCRHARGYVLELGEHGRDLDVRRKRPDRN